MMNWGELLSNFPLEMLLTLLIVVVILKFLKSADFKGKSGELLIQVINNIALDKKIYKMHDNITFNLKDGTSTQIDHIITSPYGIFVIETKNYKGWIFGDYKSRKWTQSLKSGKKFQFQNPIHQNYKHIKGLHEILTDNTILTIDDSRLISLIVFVGEARFKTKIPKNVFIGNEYISFIKSFNKEIITPIELKTINNFIERKSEEKSRTTNKEHVKNLKFKGKK